MGTLVGCYFGCVGIRLNHTLLDLPDHPAPKLCEDHAPSWRLYRASKITQTDTLSWPDDFWPWAKRIEEEMQEESKNAPTQEIRAPGTEIRASEAVVGYWYTVPSGEVERCFAIRNRGRGVQAGFAGVDSTGVDPDDVRWLPGRTSIVVSEPGSGVTPSTFPPPSEIEQERQRLSPPSFQEDLASPPSEGVLLAHVTDPATRERVRDPSLDLSVPLRGLAARTADIVVLEPPRIIPVYHKSLHIDWRTPKALFDTQVARWGPYWLDAAATQENKLCEYYLGPETDSLSVDWEPDEEITAQHGFNIWLNHPYSKGEPKCLPECNKPKCAERGYHLEKPVAPSGDWMVYARNQALGSALKFGGALTCLTKASVETQWWKESVRVQPPGAGIFVTGRSDPYGGPAKEFMDQSPYKAATWTEFRWTNFVVDIVEIEGRVDFDRGGNDGSAGFPSALVTYYKPE